MNKNNKNILDYVLAVLQKCKINEYKGWDKFDGTLSPYCIKINNNFLNFIFQQIVKESPLNLRPILRIPKTINIKGIALFILAYANLYKTFKDMSYYNEAIRLGELLYGMKNKELENDSWGHNFVWQTVGSKIEANQPNITNTYFAGMAYYDLFSMTGDERYKSIIKSIYNFISNDLCVLVQDDKFLAYSYFIIPQKNVVYNVQGMIATFYLKYIQLFSDEKPLINVKKIFNFIKNSMNSDFTWNYHTGNKYNRIDNYHSAYVIDSFWELYQFTKSEEDLEFYLKCLKVYQEKFWGPNGEPYWSLKHKYPYDIHSAANGIITFSKASVIDGMYLAKSKQILDWTIKNMYREKEQDFIYRIFGPIKYNYSFMRWGNAWMCYAISEYLKYENK